VKAFRLRLIEPVECGADGSEVDDLDGAGVDDV
jgi:hypothetical protein